MIIADYFASFDRKSDVSIVVVNEGLSPNGCKEGYSQHMIAKVLDILQPAIYGVIKRNKQ